MQQAPKAFPVRAPAQIGMRIDSACGGLLKKVSAAEGQDAAQHARKRNLINGQWSLAIATPQFLVGIGEKSITHFSEARSVVTAIFVGNRLRPKILLFHIFLSQSFRALRLEHSTQSPIRRL
jgi:hypothetical protein